VEWSKLRRKPHIIGAGFVAFASLVVSSASPSLDVRKVQKAAKSWSKSAAANATLWIAISLASRLVGVYGRVAGSVPSFQYSDSHNKSQIIWTDQTLEKCSPTPEKLVTDNEMTFHVEKSNERGELIAYLKQNSGK